MAFNTRIFLIDVESKINLSTGKNEIVIVRETPVYADKQEVGMEEYYSAVGAKIKLSATFEILAHTYHGEKYILTSDRTRQYEISRVGKGRTLAYLKLPVTSVQKKNLVEGATSG